MESFVIQKQGEEHYDVLLNTHKDRIILRGKDCSNLPKCKYLVDSIRSNATDYSKYELKTANDGECVYA